MTEPTERVGALLRANGRYSITHRFLIEKRDDGIGTACGLVYGADEIYSLDPDEGDDPGMPLFEFGHSVGAITNCAECFPRTGRTRVIKTENALTVRSETHRTTEGK